MNKVLKVQFVEGGSQAENVGICAGDIITSYDGTPVSSPLQLDNAVYAAKEAGKAKVAIGILRNGNTRVLEAVPGKLGFNAEAADIDTRSIGTPSGGGTRASEYGVAKAVAGFVAFVGWVLVVVGVVAAGFALEQTTQTTRTAPAAMIVVALMPGLISVGVGFLLVMGAQVTRAVVDTADYTREILKTVERRAAG